jgi:cytochrome c oxidase subunit 1
VFGIGMAGVALFMMGAGTLGVPRRHWDMAFTGNPFPYEFPGTAWLMMGLMGISAVIALIGGAMYLLITVGSVFFGKTVETPGFKHVRAVEGVAPAPQIGGAVAAGHGHGNIGAGGMVAPGTFVLALVFLASFILYYFVNWKYLSQVWPLK